MTADRLDLDACLQATRDTPDDDRAWQALGVALLERGRAVEAAAAFDRAVTLNPDNGPAAEGLVLTARQTGRWEPHLAALTASRAPIARQGLALHAFGQGDMARAASLFDKVLATDPANVEAAYNLAAARANLQEWNEAAAAFLTFARLRPREMEGWRGLGRARAALKQYEGAVDAYRQAIRLGGDAAACHLQLGKALGELGRWEEAATALREATRLDARSPVPFTALAFAYDRMAKGQGVLDPKWTRERCLRAELGALQAALRLNEDDANAWRSLARAREALGDHAGARDAVGRASAAARARDHEAGSADDAKRDGQAPATVDPQTGDHAAD